MAHIETGAQAPVQAPVRVEPTAHIADPAPLGLAGFATTTFVLSVFNAGFVTDPVFLGAVLPLALFYGGLGQFMAGMWEFRRGNTFGALAFSSFGAFWLSYAAYAKFVVPGLGGTAATATGVYLLAWTIFTAYLTVAAARVNAAVLAVLLSLTLTLLFLTIAELAGSPGLTKVGGWLGLVTAVFAWYASFAGVTNSAWKRTVLPVFPLAPARH